MLLPQCNCLFIQVGYIFCKYFNYNVHLPIRFQQKKLLDFNNVSKKNVEKIEKNETSPI